MYKLVGGYIQNIVGDGGSNMYEVLAALDIFKKRGNYKRESGILTLASHTCCRHCFLSDVIWDSWHVLLKLTAYKILKKG